MNFSIIIIGDEILSGHRQDKHFSYVLSAFKKRGLSLHHVQYIGDDGQQLTKILQHFDSKQEVVVTFGGIGSTPDDHTRQAVAQALGLNLILHTQAAQLITARCVERGDADMTTPENQARLNMGCFPNGAQIIPNPYNRIPGFSMNGWLYCLPGFPVMAWPMLDWVLDTYYADYFHAASQVSAGILVFELLESSLTPLMEQLEQRWQSKGIKVYSLPSVGDPMIESGLPHIELGCKTLDNTPEALLELQAAMTFLRQGVLNRRGRIIELTKPTKVNDIIK